MPPEDDITDEELEALYDEAWQGDVLSEDELNALIDEING